jgi:hypothetical protein
MANHSWRGFLRKGHWLSVNVIARMCKPSVARFDLGMIFEPEEETLFELATERLPDMGNRTRLEAGNPS